MYNYKANILNYLSHHHKIYQCMDNCYLFYLYYLLFVIHNFNNWGLMDRCIGNRCSYIVYILVFHHHSNYQYTYSFLRLSLRNLFENLLLGHDRMYRHWNFPHLYKFYKLCYKVCNRYLSYHHSNHHCIYIQIL